MFCILESIDRTVPQLPRRLASSLFGTVFPYEAKKDDTQERENSEEAPPRGACSAAAEVSGSQLFLTVSQLFPSSSALLRSFSPLRWGLMQSNGRLGKVLEVRVRVGVVRVREATLPEAAWCSPHCCSRTCCCLRVSRATLPGTRSANTFATSLSFQH